MTYQLGSNDFMIFSPKPYTAMQTCLDNGTAAVVLRAATRVTIPDGCKLRLKQHEITVDPYFRASLPSLHLEWNWSLIMSLSEISDIRGWKDNFHTITTQLHKLRNSSDQTGQFIHETQQKHLQYAWNSLFTWTGFGLASCATLAIIIFVLGIYICRNRCKRGVSKSVFNRSPAGLDDLLEEFRRARPATPPSSPSTHTQRRVLFVPRYHNAPVNPDYVTVNPPTPAPRRDVKFDAIEQCGSSDDDDHQPRAPVVTTATTHV
jgi:hypothetical protein